MKRLFLMLGALLALAGLGSPRSEALALRPAIPVFLSPLRADTAQVADKISWTVKDFTNGETQTASGDLNSETPLLLLVDKSRSGLLSVRAKLTFPSTIVLFVLEGPYGTNSTFALRPGSTSTSFGQYLNTPLCLEGLQKYRVKGFNASGDVVLIREFHIDLN